MASGKVRIQLFSLSTEFKIGQIKLFNLVMVNDIGKVKEALNCKLIKSRWQQGFLSITLSIHPYHPLLPASLPNYNRYPLWNYVDKVLLVGKNSHDSMWGFIKKTALMLSSLLF